MPIQGPKVGIRSIEIENFRGIDHLKLDFTGPSDELSPIIVLAGPNGCGKTSVLEACRWSLNAEPVNQKERQEQIKRGRKRWKIITEIENMDSRFRGESSELGGPDWTDMNVGAASQLFLPFLFFSSWRTPKLVGSLGISSGKERWSGIDLAEENRIRFTKQYLIDIKAHELMSNNSLGNEGEFARQMMRINEIWKQFHPYDEDQFVVEPVSRSSLDGFDVFLSGTNKRLSVDLLSSGQLELFTFFGTMMRMRPFAGVILIDEPELHLDPQWHALILQAIRTILPESQLIVATHSPIIYESVHSFQRFFLVPDSDPRAKAWKTHESEVPVG